jgi:hypothetical protein
MHCQAQSAAQTAIHFALECGKRLLAAHAVLIEQGEGRWCEWLDSVGVPRNTAWRYMRVAQDKGTEQLLARGCSLVDLYREFGLVKPCEGGGYRSEAYQKRKALEDSGLADQLILPFSFEDFTANVKSILVKPQQISELADSSIHELEHNLEAALVRVREVKQHRAAVVDITVEMKGES